MARPRKYDYDMILQLHHSGMPVEEIASAVKATSKVVYKILSMYQNIFPKWKVESYQCKGCGKSFIPEETGYNSKKYCSATCQNRLYQRKQNQSRDHRKRWRKHDNDISLDALYRRDHGICYLCGKICDYSDMEVVNGVFIAGNTYPSIDHIRPLSRGGTDTWDNIKLAHRLCNSKKGAAYDTDETSLDA